MLNVRRAAAGSETGSNLVRNGNDRGHRPSLRGTTESHTARAYAARNPGRRPDEVRACLRAKPAVRLLAGDHAGKPFVREGNGGRIAGDIAQVGQPTQPVGHFFPAGAWKSGLPSRCHRIEGTRKLPGSARTGRSPGGSSCLLEPALGLDAANGQFEKGGGCSSGARLGV